MNTFQIGKSKTFISGLFWQPLSGISADLRKETKQLAKELDFDLALLRTTFPQVGLTSHAQGAKAGHLSAAAVVSSTVEKESGARDFLCAAEITDGQWLYVAQRDGVILPDGDIIGSEDEIKSRLMQDLSLGSWGEVYAPAHWGIESASQERSFEDFIPQKGSKYQYKADWELKTLERFSLDKFKSTPFIILLCCLCILSWFGYKEYKNRQAAEMARQLAVSGQLPKLPHPWKIQPRSSAYLQACRDSINQAGNLWPGHWTPKEVSCNQATFSVEWTRGKYGWNEHLKITQPKATISTDGARANLSIPIKMTASEDEVAPLEADRNFAMTNAAQKYGFTINLTPVPPPPPPPPPKDGEPPQPVPDWREINWDVRTTELPPEIVVKALDANGFRISVVKSVFTNGKFNWSLEGTQYVQL